jgi:hypothetical protein
MMHYAIPISRGLSMSRKRQQAERFFKAGQLLGPLLKIVEHLETYDQDERTRILARFFAETKRFIDDFQVFTRGEPGHVYQTQYYKVVNRLGPFADLAGNVDIKGLATEIKKVAAVVFDAIYSIPVPIESSIHEAHTPFSTYCLAKDMCSTARTRIDWMDRYFDSTLFGRYFTDTPATTAITLVTWPESRCSGRKDQQRYADFMGVSKLFAEERGPERYRLLTAEDFHDRRLRCDDKMVHLGDSIKDLGKNSTFTISRLDSTDDNRRHFDDAIKGATEMFGPSIRTHP